MSIQGEPLYLQIANQLKLELDNFKAGELMSGELPLAKRFGVNRHTVRRALEILENEGFVLRIQGKGTKVLARHAVYPIKLQSAFSSSLQEMGKEVTATLLYKKFRQATLEEQKLFDFLGEGEIFEVGTLRWMEELPVLMIRHCFAVEHHAVFTAYQGGSMRSYLAGQGYHLERYSSQIGARIASLEEARRLRLSKKAPVLTVATISHDQQGEVFELAYSVSRSDSFQYKIVLKEK